MRDRPSRACPIVVATALATAVWTLASGPASAHSAATATEAAAGVRSPLPWLLAAPLLVATLFAVGRLAPARLVPRLCAGVAAALALAAVAHLAFTGKRHTLPDVGTVWSLDDDMMITLRYARNLASGDGLVWNPGERVEGITNLLWALLLAPLHWVLPPERAAAGAIALNSALLVALLWATAHLARRLRASELGAGAAAVALATHQATLHWTAAGGETPLLALLLVLVASRSIEPDPTPRSAGVAALLAGLAWCTRPDALPLLLPLLALLLWRLVHSIDPPRRAFAAVRFMGLAAALPLIATLFRLTYYGSVLPNTYWLKMTGWDGRLDAGVAYLTAGMTHQGGFALAALLGALLLRSCAGFVVLAAAAMHLAYVAHAGGDELPQERFLLPAMPFLIALGCAGVARIRDEDGAPPPATIRWRARRLAAPLLAALLLAFGSRGGGFLPATEDPAQAGRSRGERENSMIGFLLRANTAEDALIAHFWAGSAAYFSERRGLDLLGKCDPTISRQAAKPGLMKPGHNKFDFDHALGLAPDVIVGGAPGNATLQFLRDVYANPASPLHGYRAFAELYLARTFPEHYGRCPADAIGDPSRMPQLVGGAGTTLPQSWAEPSRAWHAILVRHLTPRAKPPAQWQTPAPR